MFYFGIFFNAKIAPVGLWITWWTVPNLPYPNVFPIWKSSIVTDAKFALTFLDDFNGNFGLWLLLKSLIYLFNFGVKYA